MYCPAHFQEDRPDVLLGLIGQHPLGTVIANGADGLVADHVPLFHEPGPDSPGRLFGHVARSNPLWQCAPDQELLVIFQGPSTYISPNWYASKAEAGRVVPTWNYAVVHAHVTLKALQRPQDILPIVTRLTDRHEASQPHPWRVSDAPDDYIHRLLAGIVGIELAITRIQGKWKVSQNQPAPNRQTVADALLGQGTDAASQMAQWVRSSGRR